MHLYVIQSSVTGAIKVGRSSNPEARLNELQVGSPYHLRIICVVPESGDREKEIHAILYQYRIRQRNGEWFKEEAIGILPDFVRERMLGWHVANPNWYQE